MGSIKLLICTALMMIGITSVSAEPVADPRMSVWVSSAKSHVSVPQAIGKALPILWDRVLLQSSRDLVSDTMNATSFLLRATPKADGVFIEFNAARVWQYLEKKDVAFIREPLRARLLIKMFNQHGASMTESAALLQQHATNIAINQGIALDATAPALVLSWRWIDHQQLHLTVRGHPKVPERSEVRALISGDPQVQLTAWLQEVLLQARDASVLTIALEGEEEPTIQDVSLQLVLTIERHAALAEQISLEEALRQHPQVISLTPQFLTIDQQQYQLQLKDQYDGWLATWLTKYGLQASKGPTGWLAK